MENNKHKFWKGVLVGSLVTAFAGLLIVGMSAGIFLIGSTVIQNQENSQQISQDSDGSELNYSKIMAKMGLIKSAVDEYFLFDQDPEKIEDGIYTGMMYGLEDPYSVYYNEKDYETLVESTEGEYCGIGVMVSQNRTTGVMTVSRVFEGAPGYEAGMLTGDIFYKINGENITGMELDKVVSDYIKGEEGTSVEITVLRGEEAKEVTMNVERRQVEVPTVEYEMLENQVGYVLVTQFDGVTAEQFKTAIDDLESQGMEKLVIDLRGNPGGVLEAVVDMMAYVLPEDKMDGLLISTADKNGKGDRFYCKDGQIHYESDFGTIHPDYPKKDDHQIDVPMALLVDGNSASAAEVFTGAMMDYDQAVVVGTQTFGKGIVQHLLPLGDGTAIKLTVSHYYTPGGTDLHKKGLTPDVVVELDPKLRTNPVIPLEEDNQVQAVLEALEQ